MGKTYSFFNQKGGVGKTTSVINIAAVLAMNGKKVLLIDLDAQGNATSGLGIEKNENESTAYQLLVENSDPNTCIKVTTIENLKIIPSNAHLAGAEMHLISQEKREYILLNQLKKIEKDYDYIFLDCPPSLGLTSINALTASSYVVIPLQCEYYALEGLGQLLNTYQLVKKNLHSDLELGGVILTMADARTNLTQQVIEEVRNYFKEKVFQTVVPRSVKLSEAPSFGKPAVIYDPSSRGSKSYVDLAKEFLVRFGTEEDRKIFSGETKTVVQEAPATEGTGEQVPAAQTNS
ncbi:MAG TPA: AAA family ATPase [Candidatus Omnitrophota bacterium]|nr:AAA family ATPase [Candidatus Omnitrophota bacterium]HPS36580.1 AAA family ATPase [Candidatus Omnitrophota bacterium]